MLEAAPEEESGGNSRFTAGSIRVVYNGVEDIKTLVPDLTEAEIHSHCRGKLANYKVPKRFFIRASLPMLAVGKVDKAALRIEATALAGPSV